VDSLSKGESLRDTLREAATGFLEELTKKSLNNLLRGVVFGQGEGGFQGLLGSIFGKKDDGKTEKGVAGALNVARGENSGKPLFVSVVEGGIGSIIGSESGDDSPDSKTGVVSKVLQSAGLGPLNSLLNIGGGSANSKGSSEANPLYVNVVNGGVAAGAAGATGGQGGFLGGLIGNLAGAIPGIGPAIKPALQTVGLAEGGRVTGGSGMKDDVPAVLMGGEYVVKKDSVRKYGTSFMEALNSGNLPGFAGGGMVGGDPIGEYSKYRRNENNSFRTQSGILASDWTPKASTSKQDEEGLDINKEERTESGILASKWVSQASIEKARRKKTEERIRIRTESGIESSDWTPAADSYSVKSKETKETKETKNEVRTQSGLFASDATPQAGLDKTFKPEERLKNKELRSDSGLFSSKWIDARNFLQEKKERVDENLKFRSKSGIFASEATPKASLDSSFDPNLSGEKRKSSDLKLDKNQTAAALTAGEFVMSRESVKNLGVSFMDALNKGEVKKFSQGGLIPGSTFAREEKDFRTTDIFGSPVSKGSLKAQKGPEYYVPGLYGQGEIKGDQQLLDFATQAFTSGRNDVIGSAQGASYISLEPESARLTNFGRLRDTPLQRATKEAKGQAFALNKEFQEQVAAYQQLLEDIKQAEKDRKKQLLKQMVISIATMGLTAGIQGAAAGAANGGGVSGAIGGFFTGGGANNTGGIFNVTGAGSYYQKQAGYNIGGEDALKTGAGYATGGYVGGGSNIDSVSTMLTGGEFVLNRAATQNIGQDNLQQLNSGGENQTSEKVVDKLDEILKATKDNNGEININVSGVGGNSSGGGGGGGSSSQGSGSSSVETKGQNSDTKYREDLAKLIKNKVLEVLREEKRLGGTLR
jgi:hypothetical protein